MKFNKFTLCLVLLAGAITCLGQSYTIMDVGTLPASFPYSLGTAVNNSGEVVGYASASFSQQPWLSIYHPFSYNHGVIRDLGRFIT